MARKLRCPYCDYTFNSLSRDHSGGERSGHRGHAYCLSTPSLGITNWMDFARLAMARRDFQLPLSGSQGDDEHFLMQVASATFNSLSRDHEMPKDLPEETRKLMTFNSLSRDHPVIPVIDPQGSRVPLLSTPSLGITSLRTLRSDVHSL